MSSQEDLDPARVLVGLIIPNFLQEGTCGRQIGGAECVTLNGRPASADSKPEPCAGSIGLICSVFPWLVKKVRHIQCSTTSVPVNFVNKITCSRQDGLANCVWIIAGAWLLRQEGAARLASRERGGLVAKARRLVTAFGRNRTPSSGVQVDNAPVDAILGMSHF
jgi:hypothetical protein